MKRIIYPPAPWALLARQWERALRAENKSHNTIHAYIQAVRLFGEWAHRQDPAVRPAEVTSKHVQAFMAELIERTSPGNAHTNYRSLRTFWKWMVLEEEVDHSPMDRTKPPYVPEKPIPIIPDDAVKALLEVCRGRDFTSRRDTAIIRVLFDTGARLSEVANLVIDDVDLDVDVIHVLGKGRRSRAIPFGPKTGQALTRYLLTPAQRSLRTRTAAHASWARTADRAARTEPARRAALARFEKQVDPHHELEPEERQRRAASARRAYFQLLALRSARARGSRRQPTRPFITGDLP